MNGKKEKSIYSIEVFIFSILFFAFFALIGNEMGMLNMFNTIMNTSYALLFDTVFYIMSIAVLTGAIGSLFSEFGVIALINKVLSPIMKPVYGLPGASAIGVLTTYLSDNPAILALANDSNFKKYFKKYQIVALTNIGTSFGMGLIITTYMITLPSNGENFLLAVFVGNVGAIFGSIISTRMMLRFAIKEYGAIENADSNVEEDIEFDYNVRTVSDGSVGERLLNSVLSGGRTGVDMGIAIIPGVLIICTFVLLLTNSPSSVGYTGGAYEGVGLLPAIAEKFNFIIQPLFGFTSSEAIAVPITALGAAGAAIGLIPQLLENGLAHANDIAVFTAMCMCWSGYLSTHVAMMDGLGSRQLTGKAILSHTVGGISAGIFANWLFKILVIII